MRAFAVGLKHWPVDTWGVTAAKTAGGARYVVYLQVRDIGWSYQITDFRVLRIPALDGWAKTAAPGHWGADYIAGGRAALHELHRAEAASAADPVPEQEAPACPVVPLSSSSCSPSC